MTPGLCLNGFLISGLPTRPPPDPVTPGLCLNGFLKSGLPARPPPVVVTLGLPPDPGFGGLDVFTGGTFLPLGSNF